MSSIGWRSVVVEVDDAVGGATVVVRWADGATDPRQRHRVSCSCGESECAHVWMVVAELARGLPLQAFAPPQKTPGPTSVRLRAGALRSAPPQDRAAGGYAEVADGLSALAISLLRSGRESVSTSFDEAIRSALEMLGPRAQPCMLRLLSRVEWAFGPRGTSEDAALAVAALGVAAVTLRGEEGDGNREGPRDSSSRVEGRLEGIAPEPSMRGELSADTNEAERMEGLELVEIARVRERGRVRWETRLLVDLHGGPTLREEGALGAPSLSDGPCGRRVSVNLAVRLPGRAPSRARLVQYAVDPAASERELDRVVATASRDLSLPAAATAAPLLLVAAPIAVWLAPHKVDIEAGGAIVLSDAEGNALQIDGEADPGAALAFAEIVAGDQLLRAVAGALVVGSSGIALAPWSAIVETSRGRVLLPLTL